MRPSHARHWSEFVRDCETAGHPYVIATVLGARGSTPRDSGTKMVVTLEGSCGTIGGGQLEYAVQQRALELLGAGLEDQRVENFPLGEKLGQCCGGATSVLLECFQARRTPCLLFGAGHVGRALAPLLAALPVRLQWIDSRAEEFPQALPDGVQRHVADEPLDVIASAPAGSAYIIMTHQHPLDYALTEAALRRGDASYIGLIGSASKWRRFRLRLAHRGFEDAQINAVSCPIGLDAVPGKHPAEIAVSVAGELIAHYHAQSAPPSSDGPGWKHLQAQLATSGALNTLTEDTDP